VIGTVEFIKSTVELQAFMVCAELHFGIFKQLLKEEIKIFGSALHGHLAARQITARHFRNGTEIGIIDRDGHYDFNYQQVKMFEKPIEMLPVSASTLQSSKSDSRFIINSYRTYDAL